VPMVAYEIKKNVPKITIEIEKIPKIKEKKVSKNPTPKAFPLKNGILDFDIKNFEDVHHSLHKWEKHR